MANAEEVYQAQGLACLYELVEAKALVCQKELVFKRWNVPIDRDVNFDGIDYHLSRLIVDALIALIHNDGFIGWMVNKHQMEVLKTILIRLDDERLIHRFTVFRSQNNGDQYARYTLQHNHL